MVRLTVSKWPLSRKTVYTWLLWHSSSWRSTIISRTPDMAHTDRRTSRLGDFSLWSGLFSGGRADIGLGREGASNHFACPHFKACVAIWDLARMPRLGWSWTSFDVAGGCLLLQRGIWIYNLIFRAYNADGVARHDQASVLWSCPIYRNPMVDSTCSICHLVTPSVSVQGVWMPWLSLHTNNLEATGVPDKA